MNDQLVLTIAETILANTKLLQSLVDTLPKATVAKITEKVEKVTKVTPVAAPVQAIETVAPVVVETVTAPVVETVTPPVAVVAPVVTPAPAPAPAPAPVFVAAAPKVPFTDHPGLLKWIMDSYQRLGQEKGAQIQTVLGNIGVRNINDVKPDQWATLVAGVEAL